MRLRKAACYVAPLKESGIIWPMRLVEAQYEDGFLKPIQPLPLRRGERVGLIVVRRPDPARWDLKRLAATSTGEDIALANAGLDDWADQLDEEDRR